MLIKLFLLSSLVMTGAYAGSPQGQDSTQNTIRILKKSEITKIIGLPPKKGSVEDLKDFATILKFQVTRSEADCKLAKSFVDVGLKSLFSDNNGPLSQSEARRMTLKLLPYTGEAMVNIYTAKNMHDRPRPYLANPLVKPCIDKERTTAYPSGHATYARVMAIALSQVYPERTEALMARADLIALSRVIGGVHHPTDIEAGKKLADAMAANFLESEEFMEMLTDLR